MKAKKTATKAEAAMVKTPASATAKNKFEDWTAEKLKAEALRIPLLKVNCSSRTLIKILSVLVSRGIRIKYKGIALEFIDGKGK